MKIPIRRLDPVASSQRGALRLESRKGTVTAWFYLLALSLVLNVAAPHPGQAQPERECQFGPVSQTPLDSRGLLARLNELGEGETIVGVDVLGTAIADALRQPIGATQTWPHIYETWVSPMRSTRGLSLRCSRIHGSIELRDVTVPMGLELRSVEFVAPSGQGGSLGVGVRARQVTFLRPIFIRAKAAEAIPLLDLVDVRSEDFTVVEGFGFTRIKGAVFKREVRVTASGTSKEDITVEDGEFLDRLTLDATSQRLFFGPATAKGGVLLRVGGSMTSIENARFESPLIVERSSAASDRDRGLTLASCQLGSALRLGSNSASNLHLYDSAVGGATLFVPAPPGPSGSTMELIHIAGSRFQKRVDMSYVAAKEINFEAGQTTLEPTTFLGDLFMRDAVAGSLNVSSAEFAGFVDLSGSSFQSRVDLGGAGFGGPVDFHDVRFPPRVAAAQTSPERSKPGGVYLRTARFTTVRNLDYSQLVEGRWWPFGDDVGRLGDARTRDWRKLETLFNASGDLASANGAYFQRRKLAGTAACIQDCENPVVNRLGWGFWGYGVRPARLVVWPVLSSIVIFLLAAWKHRWRGGPERTSMSRARTEVIDATRPRRLLKGDSGEALGRAAVFLHRLVIILCAIAGLVSITRVSPAAKAIADKVLGGLF